MQVFCGKCNKPLVVKKYKCANCGADLPEGILGITLYVDMMEDGVNPDKATEEEIQDWFKKNRSL
jgi:hypothetical protein